MTGIRKALGQLHIRAIHILRAVRHPIERRRQQHAVQEHAPVLSPHEAEIFHEQGDPSSLRLALLMSFFTTIIIITFLFFGSAEDLRLGHKYLDDRHEG